MPAGAEDTIAGQNAILQIDVEQTIPVVGVIATILNLRTATYRAPRRESIPGTVGKHLFQTRGIGGKPRTQMIAAIVLLVIAVTIMVYAKTLS